MKKVTAGDSPDIVLWGSSTLYSPLLEANVIDGVNLLIYPIMLSKGKRLLGGTSHPVIMKPVTTETSKSAIIVAKYERALNASR